MKEILVRSSTGPSKIRERFAMLVKDGYKGSDYGVFAFECTMVKPPIGQKEIETARGNQSYPFVIGSQIIEPGIQAYTGKWALKRNLLV
jgi:hypothetical protein